VIDVSQYLKKKETNYLTQIDTLGRQNQTLFEENASLSKKLMSETKVYSHTFLGGSSSD
jgi:hypothetical protein